jgi:hypothetical protein
MLNLSRNLGRLTGASVMGAVFALASATSNITTARPEAVATGMRTTFAVAAILNVVALAIAVGSRALAQRSSPSGDVSCLLDVTRVSVETASMPGTCNAL